MTIMEFTSASEMRANAKSVKQRFANLKPKPIIIQVTCGDVPVPVPVSKRPFEPVIQNLLIEYPPPIVPGPNKCRGIARVVAEFYGVKIADIMSERRTKDIVRPRQVTYYLCKELTLKSYPHVGREIGDRDHSTVMHGVKKITRLIQSDTELAAKVDALKARCRELKLCAA